MTVLEYFKARLEATKSPMDIMNLLKAEPESICIIDVRNGPAPLLKERIKGALQIPQSIILEKTAELPKDKLLVLYCWDTWCSLAAKSAVPLLEQGFTVCELYGGLKAWDRLRFPVEPVDAKALEICDNPLEKIKSKCPR